MLAVLFAASLSSNLPPTCAYDDSQRPVDGGVLQSATRPAVEIRVDAGLVYIGCFPCRIGTEARGTRYLFLDAEGSRPRRAFIAQFEAMEASSKEIYRYDMSAAEELGGLRFRQNTFAFSGVAEAGATADEGSLTAAFLLQRGYELPAIWLASRFVTLGSEDRKSEMILFYMEPGQPGLTLGDLYRADEPTPTWQSLRTGLEERSRKAFSVSAKNAAR